ncbi:trichohyalin-like [Pituophis catenifer annectens]|uniref:trichohyalin-like n=1 Tax=Pituophis catenifer annectens TaxID=94852 RepID=UPI003994E7AA
MDRASFYLRFQNVVEDKEEDLGEKMAELIADALHQDKQAIIRELDELRGAEEEQGSKEELETAVVEEEAPHQQNTNEATVEEKTEEEEEAKEKKARPVSRRPENIRMQLDQDLNLRMRSHQIVHTKTERLEVDLKRARNQSYAKTMEMSKLLTEKEELELKIQELTNKNLQLAKEKEELFILCKEYEEKLSREKSSDEPGQLDKLRRENESLSCKLKKYAGENAELLQENNDLKEEFYRKRAVIAKLAIENKELEMKTEVLTFKNIELTDEKEELCREYEIRLWRETQLRKGRCPLMMDRDQMEQRPSSRESKGGSGYWDQDDQMYKLETYQQVSRRPENIRMQLDQDLNLRMRSHQIVHTKTERLEVDLKRARNQSYAKTMEMSKLLTEKEELELKIQELTNKNLQLAKEKEELFILCKEYEEKLSREKSSDEPGQLDKLRRENESLSCKLKKYAGENAELLRENNDLKEEFYRKRAVIAKLAIENKELEMKTEVLTFKNIELTDEKEELCREYEIRLWRETQLRKGRCPLMMDRDQMEQRPSSRESKGGSGYWDQDDQMYKLETYQQPNDRALSKAKSSAPSRLPQFFGEAKRRTRAPCPPETIEN